VRPGAARVFDQGDRGVDKRQRVDGAVTRFSVDILL
jgi:hypothetical protein